MNAKKARFLTAVVGTICLVSWIMIAVILIAYGNHKDDDSAVSVKTTVAPSAFATPPTGGATEPTLTQEPTPTENLKDVFYSDEDGWVTVVADELRIRSEANLDCEVYEMVTKGTGFVWMKALTTDEWVAIWYKSNQVAYLSADYVEVEVNEFQNVYTVEDSINKLVLPTRVPSITSVLTQKLDGDASNMVITPIPSATNTPTPTPSPTCTPSPTPKPTATNTPTPRPTNTPVPEVKVPVSAGDEDLLTALILTEAGYNYEEMLGVGQVVINRMLNKGDSMYDIIHAPGQFSVVRSGRFADAYDKWTNKTYSSGMEAHYALANKAAKEIIAGGSNPDFTWLYFRVTSDYYESKYPNHVVIGTTIFHDGRTN